MFNEDYTTEEVVQTARKVRSAVERSIVNGGLSFEQAVDALAEYLDMDPSVIKVAIGIANEIDKRKVL